MMGEWIPTLTFGSLRYSNYPIRNMTRQETETLLRHPSFRRTLILRISVHALQEEPHLYYVASYFPPSEGDLPPPVHLLVTREVHDAHRGNLTSLLPHSLEGYSLLFLPHHVAYSETRMAS